MDWRGPLGFLVCPVTATPTFSSVLPSWREYGERLTLPSLLAWPGCGPWLKLETWARSAVSLDPSPCLSLVKVVPGLRPACKINQISVLRAYTPTPRISAPCPLYLLYSPAQVAVWNGRVRHRGEKKKSSIVNVLATGQFKETSGSACFSVARTARTLNCRDASSNPSFFCISQTNFRQFAWPWLKFSPFSLI